VAAGRRLFRVPDFDVMTSPDSTIPAPPKLPTNLSTQVDPAVGDDAPAELETLKDSADAQWDQVKAAFNSCVETQKETLLAISKLSTKVDERFAELNASRAAESKILVARFDDVDREIEKARSGITRSNSLIAALNQIVVGTRSASNSHHDQIESQRVRLIELGDEIEAVRMSLPDQPPPGLRVVSREG
jgi:chromosome segregation ATPase